MVAITIERQVIEILQAYIRDEALDVVSVLNNFAEEDFTFSVKFHKYKSCLNAPAAKVIINFQEAI